MGALLYLVLVRNVQNVEVVFVRLKSCVIGEVVKCNETVLCGFCVCVQSLPSVIYILCIHDDLCNGFAVDCNDVCGLSDDMQGNYSYAFLFIP